MAGIAVCAVVYVARDSGVFAVRVSLSVTRGKTGKNSVVAGIGVAFAVAGRPLSGMGASVDWESMLIEARSAKRCGCMTGCAISR